MQGTHHWSADTALVGSVSPASRRTPLSARLVLVTAVAFIDEHGVADLTMRKLGQSLGVEAMALYRHVAGKDQVLDGVVGLLVEDMRGAAQLLEASRHGWQDYLRGVAHGVRRVALAHPLAFPLVAARAPDPPWLRSPLRDLDMVEAFVTELRAEGFSQEACVTAYRAFTSFLLGHLLLEVSTPVVGRGPAEAAQVRASDGLADHPQASSLHPYLTPGACAAEFDEALETVLGRLALLKEARSR